MLIRGSPQITNVIDTEGNREAAALCILLGVPNGELRTVGAFDRVSQRR
jgi:hypothetical protein